MVASDWLLECDKVWPGRLAVRVAAGANHSFVVAEGVPNGGALAAAGAGSAHRVFGFGCAERGRLGVVSRLRRRREDPALAPAVLAPAAVAPGDGGGGSGGGGGDGVADGWAAEEAALSADPSTPF